LDGYNENIAIGYINKTFTQLNLNNGVAELFIRYNEKQDDNINKLKDLIKYILTSKKKSINETNKTGKNYHNVINSILKLFRALLDYGYIVSHEEISMFSMIIIHNLSSEDDFPQNENVPDTVRYFQSYENMIIFENKRMMCDILNDILSIRINVINQ